MDSSIESWPGLHFRTAKYFYIIDELQINILIARLTSLYNNAVQWTYEDMTVEYKWNSAIIKDINLIRIWRKKRNFLW